MACRGQRLLNNLFVATYSNGIKHSKTTGERRGRLHGIKTCIMQPFFHSAMCIQQHYSEFHPFGDLQNMLAVSKQLLI